MNILVGYDGSNAAMDAMKLAKKHAKAFDAKVYVVTSLRGGSDSSDDKISTGEQYLDFARDFFENKGISVETHLLVRGMEPGEDIVQFARENNTDEIIIGVRKRSNMGKILFGSTARYVILEASCPVVTIK